MARASQLLQSFAPLLAGLKVRTRALLGLWACFLLLVLAGIHGSSTGVTAAWWAPEKPYTGYLLMNAPTETAEEAAADTWRNLMMANGRWIRWDELLIATPLALSQLSHQPKFPVINTNIGAGQNMLVYQHTPVLHISSLARPSTWGYFVLGAQRGLAWYWWFPVFAAFTVLYLLLEIVLQGKAGLAAFGAFWYCASAYVVGWSLWPAYTIFFIALATLATYHICRAEKSSTLAVCSLLLGLSLPGFLMIMYPPWQVSLGYVFLVLFAGLAIRDRLYHSFKSRLRHRLLALAGAAALAGLLIGAYLFTCLSDLRVMSETVYPGKRISLGGDYSFALLFEGMYNFITLYYHQPELVNQTEAASFYYLFPAVLLAMILSPKLLARLGVISWLLGAFVVGVLFFLLVGLPETVAKLTYWSYVPPYRADAALGLASIFLCMQTLAITERRDFEKQGLRERAMPWLASALVAALFIGHGVALREFTKGYFALSTVLLVSSVAGLCTWLLLRGKRLAFCGIVGAVVVLTAWGFNPLSTNLDHIYESELAQAVTRLNQQAGDHPLWICYGGIHPGLLVTTLGGRSLSGAQWPPQLSLWQILDPTGFYKDHYNRYSLVTLVYGDRQEGVNFHSHSLDSLTVRISPHAPVLKNLGARYVLVMKDAQKQVKTDNLELVYRSAWDNFQIYEIRY